MSWPNEVRKDLVIAGRGFVISIGTFFRLSGAKYKLLNKLVFRLLKPSGRGIVACPSANKKGLH